MILFLCAIDLVLSEDFGAIEVICIINISKL